MSESQVDRDALLRALELGAQVASSQEARALPILTNVKIANHKVVATNTVRTVSCSIEFAGGSPSLLVGAKGLLDRISTMPSGTITLVADDTSLTIKSGRRRHKLPIISVLRFPDTEAPPDDDEFVTVSASELRRGLNSVKHAVARDGARPHLEAICWEADDGKLRLIATDGHRLATCLTTIEWEHTGIMLVSRDVVNGLLKFLGKAETVEIGRSGPSLCWRIEENMLFAKLLDGSFVPWRRVIPDSAECSLTTSAQALRAAVEAVSKACDRGRDVIRLESNDSELLVSAESPEHGESRDVVPFSGTFSREPIGCNPAFLTDALQTIDGDVTLCTGGCLDPIRVDVDGETVGVLMPIRV